MALTPRLEMRQGQALVMTPQLQQAIKLLQLSNLELHSYVQEELEKNPLLERDERSEAPAQNEADSDASSGAGDDQGSGLVETDIQLDNASGVTDAGGDLDTSFENVFDGEAASKPETETKVADVAGDAGWNSVTGSGGSFNGSDVDPMAFVSQEATLQDHLNEQVQIAIKDQAKRIIAADLIDSVDEAGYLTATVEGVADRLGTKPEEVEEVLKQIQRFDPPGICARSLQECLSIQLKELDRFDPAMEALIENLELLARHDFARLQKVCGVDLDDLRDMVQEIQDLNPKPGHAFGGEVAQPVIPDVFIRENQEGGWHVELNSETMPRVLVNARYYAEISTTAHNKDDKVYLNECLNNANWLVKSLDQRARTILKVATELVKQQDGFFAHGVQHLRPLNLKVIADAIETHESTVSRVAANKYISTPRGLFEMKYFFTSAIASTSGGDAYSAEAVRAKIKDLIDQEDPKKVLSDDKLVEILREAGVDIARRTVAKYREALKIPSSVQRRRLKKMSA